MKFSIFSPFRSDTILLFNVRLWKQRENFFFRLKFPCDWDKASYLFHFKKSDNVDEQTTKNKSTQAMLIRDAPEHFHRNGPLRDNNSEMSFPRSVTTQQLILTAKCSGERHPTLLNLFFMREFAL